MHVIFSDDSLQDLGEIWDFLADHSHETASRTVRELVDACAELGVFPERFPVAEELKPPGLRRRNVGVWAIFYEVQATHVDVVRILHGGRNLRDLELTH